MDNNIIYDLLKEMRDEQRHHAEKSSLHREETLKWQAETNSRLENIEYDLREHKEGVINNRYLIKIQDERLEKLENERKSKEIIKKEKERKFKKYMKYGGAISLSLGILSYVLKIFDIF